MNFYLMRLVLELLKQFKYFFVFSWQFIIALYDNVTDRKCLIESLVL